MKRFLAFLFAIITVLALVGCGENNLPNGGLSPGSGGNPPPGRKIFEGSPHEDDWSDGASYDYINGVWDSHVLPDFFPTQPTTGTLDDITTRYIGVDDPKHSNSSIGEVSFPDYDYYYYEVNFLGDEEHQTYLINELSEQGFFISYDDSWGNNRLFINAFASDYYVNVRRYDSDENPQCPYEFNCIIIPKQMVFPVATFNEVPLPSFGYVTTEYDLTYMKYETDYSDFEEVSFSVSTTNPWFFDVELEGVSQADANAYETALTSSGWTALENGYYEKGTKVVLVEYDATSGVFTLEAASDDATAVMIGY